MAKTSLSPDLRLQGVRRCHAFTSGPAERGRTRWRRSSHSTAFTTLTSPLRQLDESRKKENTDGKLDFEPVCRVRWRLGIAPDSLDWKFGGISLAGLKISSISQLTVRWAHYRWWVGVLIPCQLKMQRTHPEVRSRVSGSQHGKRIEIRRIHANNPAMNWSHLLFNAV